MRLQRSLARKNEKLDFLEEHIQQLVTEIKKKNRSVGSLLQLGGGCGEGVFTDIHTCVYMM